MDATTGVSRGQAFRQDSPRVRAACSSNPSMRTAALRMRRTCPRCGTLRLVSSVRVPDAPPGVARAAGRGAEPLPARLC